MSTRLVSVLALVGVALSCNPGEKLNNGPWVKECLSHPILGTYEKTIGCHDINYKGVDETVPFGGSIKFNGNGMHGFVKTCSSANGRTSFSTNACYAFDLASNDHVIVPIGQSRVVEMFHDEFKLFSCKTGNEAPFFSVERSTPIYKPQ